MAVALLGAAAGGSLVMLGSSGDLFGRMTSEAPPDTGVGAI